MSTFLNSIRSILVDLKTYFKIKIKYPKLYPSSKIESYIPSTVRLGEHIKIKPNCSITDELKRIGTGTYIGDYTSIMGCKEIGNYCSISHGVKIGLNNHALDHISTNPIFYDSSNGWIEKTSYTNKDSNRTVIEHDVLISANVLIIAGVTIGTGSVIGAGAFVNKDIPPYSIVVGTPGKVIKKRFDEETITKLLLSKWWELDKVELLKHQQNFNNINNFLDAEK